MKRKPEYCAICGKAKSYHRVKKNRDHKYWSESFAKQKSKAK